ncbi:hypothetical protein CCACVL1_19682 [Corchorus capsularis]|uniref:Uncharacterized protein n=1 Tax=Corchorus capsularis TaxID=210143 RepID=A0A1R3HFI9_COCAP|nr:hypothetical protein CCACVL1_19682 [Corchorus capsularis]
MNRYRTEKPITPTSHTDLHRKNRLHRIVCTVYDSVRSVFAHPY